MGDAILSVRINEELKDKFVTLAQSSGINNKEFMEQLVSVYELNNTATSKNTYSSGNFLRLIFINLLFLCSQ